MVLLFLFLLSGCSCRTCLEGEEWVQTSDGEWSCHTEASRCQRECGLRDEWCRSVAKGEQLEHCDLVLEVCSQECQSEWGAYYHRM